MSRSARSDNIYTEAIERATRLALRVRDMVDEAWGHGPMTRELTPAQIRRRLNSDPRFRQQALEAVGPDPILDMMLGEETRRAMGLPPGGSDAGRR